MLRTPSLIAFGPLSTCSSAQVLASLQQSVSNNELFRPIRDAIETLPELWEELVEKDSLLKVQNFNCLTLASDLKDWVAQGKALQSSTLESNAARLPLTIIRHIYDYIEYLKCNSLTHDGLTDSVTESGGFQGFCVGLLSAVTVADSRTEQDITLRAALAVRLAFVMGVFVELNTSKTEQTSCLALRWNPSRCDLQDVRSVLGNRREAYVSIIRGQNEVTITIPKAEAAEASRELALKGVSSLDTGLTGRYHSPSYGGIAKRILTHCEKFMVTNDQRTVSVRSNSTGAKLDPTDLLEAVIEEIMTKPSDWPLVLEMTRTAMPLRSGKPVALALGSETILSALTDSIEIERASSLSRSPRLSRTNLDRSPYPSNAVAIIGMSCKFPGANGPDEFWQLLMRGDAKVERVPSNRWPESISTRGSSGKGQFWGNFISDFDTFDHRFFKKSSREAASMDPQQRLLLQGAYEALESAGYFSKPPQSREHDVGCYLGLCAVDYDSNIASHPPTAYSSLGSLRAFLSGKISHFFGWQGPSLTFDTACSSSAVAIHAACRAIQAGECKEAIAGGVALFTTPYLFENLSAAHFLSPTGPTKPFDAKADGYCRGEGLGLVMMKKLSDAVADGDNILAVVGGSAVNQNANCVPITVPNAPSQKNLYLKAATQAGVDPHKITFIEAHGTGTPVGDPIEMDSIRTTFCGSRRQSPLFVSSVKGNIGHLEGASGVAGLIKAILQIQHRQAPPQASFKSLNPSIPPLEPDLITIPTSTTALSDNFLTACVNNYGAAGSNSTIVLLQPPEGRKPPTEAAGSVTYPVQIAANSEASLIQYCQALGRYLDARPNSERMLRGIAYQTSQRLNQSLPFSFASSVDDVQTLRDQLLAQTAGSSARIEQRPEPPKVVLAFGGQVRDYAGLRSSLWEQSALFRSHMDDCDRILRSLGYESLYPSVFQSETLSDIAMLHSAVFSVQYASAKSWIDSDLKVDAVIGHSLGQLTALVVSGILSLEDGIKFVAGRASLMKKHWGSEAGSMILVEADLATLSTLSHNLEIACYNGQNSHVMVGEKAAVDVFESTISETGLRAKKLQVTQGFHSKFTDPLIAPLQQLAETLHFRRAVLPIETCSAGESWATATAELLAKHTREPVYFQQAVERLAQTHGPSTWLEVGFDSGISGMARRVIEASSSAGQHSYVPLSLGKESAISDATVQLWKKGHRVQSWSFHRLQRQHESAIFLPPYQWEKTRHWLQLEAPAPAATASPKNDKATVAEPEIPALIRLTESKAEESSFRISPRCEEYKQWVSGHVVAGSPLCPATVYLEVAARALQMLLPETDFDASRLGFSNLHIESPLGLAPDTDSHLTLNLRRRSATVFDFSVASNSPAKSPLLHATGAVSVRHDRTALDADFARYERLTGTHVVQSLLADPEAECIRGPTLYKLFSRVVKYSAPYQGLRDVSAKGALVAGKAAASTDALKFDTLTHPPIVDSWMQISGINANNFYPCPADEVFVFTKLDHIQFGFGYLPPTASTSWLIYSNLTVVSPKELSNDIFVFDDASKELVVLILGARFSNVRLSSLTKVLSRVNRESTTSEAATIATTSPHPHEATPKPAQNISPKQPAKTVAKVKKPPAQQDSIFAEVCSLFERVAEVSRSSIKGHMTTDDLGIDSLMMMEVISELASHFQIDMPTEDVVELTTVDSLVSYLCKRDCGQSVESAQENSVNSKTSSEDGSSTPPSSGVSSPSLNASTSSLEQLGRLLQEHLELATLPQLSDNLADMGLDSLLAIELASDIEKIFSSTIDLYQINEKSTVRDLAALAGLSSEGSANRGDPHATKNQTRPTAIPAASDQTSVATRDSALACENLELDFFSMFNKLRHKFDNFSKQEHFEGFLNHVYPDQAQLVESYIADALKKLGCDITRLDAGEPLPRVVILEKHSHLLARMYHILAEGGYLEQDSSGQYLRTSDEFNIAQPQQLLEKMISKYPIHAPEHRLLNVTGSRLAECLTGKVDPLSILFANRANRQLLADVYDLAPMCRAATRLLSQYLETAFGQARDDRIFHLLEVGGGTGGTTRFLVDHLMRAGIPFTYTFTDVSSALVSQMKKNMAGNNHMRFATVDVEKPPVAEHTGKYHAVISTNCIHATRNATSSLANLRTMLRPDGFLGLVEFTRGLYWFDLVYGLLDGWWLFSDGRKHALADEEFWRRNLLAAGYQAASWSDGDSAESGTLRVICGFNSAPGANITAESQLSKRAGISTETVAWKKCDGITLEADVYYPQSDGMQSSTKRPIALLFHGGGHVLFTRRDIHMKHIKSLLSRGFLPVSVDYRLCPEVTLAAGPMTDARDALAWAREILPFRRLAVTHVAPSATHVVAIGWSAGGHLAMTLAYTAPAQGIKAPEAVLAFYCPSNFEAEWWRQPILPGSVNESPGTTYELLEGVQAKPLVGYKPRTLPGAPMTLTDPRWRIIIHYNWRAQILPVLIRGLPAKGSSATQNSGIDWTNLPQPTQDEVREVSPFAQIQADQYFTPTFIIHGDQDDLIPWTQSRDTIEALKSRGIAAGIAIPQGSAHAFDLDLWGKEDAGTARGWEAIDSGWDFVSRFVF